MGHTLVAHSMSRKAFNADGKAASRHEGETGWHGARRLLRYRAVEVSVEAGMPIARRDSVLFKGNFPVSWVVVGTLVLGCAHARERHARLLPTAAQLRMYDVILRSPLRTFVDPPDASNCNQRERNGGMTACFWHRMWSNRDTSTDIGGVGMKGTSTHSGPTISGALRSISRQRTPATAEPPCTTATSARVTTRSPPISCRFRVPSHSSQRHHHRRRQSQIEIVTRWGRRS